MVDLDKLRNISYNQAKWTTTRTLADLAAAVYEQYQGGGLEPREFAQILNRLLDTVKIYHDPQFDFIVEQIMEMQKETGL